MIEPPIMTWQTSNRKKKKKRKGCQWPGIFVVVSECCLAPWTHYSWLQVMLFKLTKLLLKYVFFFTRVSQLQTVGTWSCFLDGVCLLSKLFGACNHTSWSYRFNRLLYSGQVELHYAPCTRMSFFFFPPYNRYLQLNTRIKWKISRAKCPTCWM